MARPFSLTAREDAETSGLLRSFFLYALIIVLAVCADALFFPQDASLKREGGGLETISAVLYLVGVGLFFKTVPRAFWSSLWQVPALLLLFAMREMDLDKAFTSSGVLSTGLYRGESSLGTKLIAGAVVVFVLVVLYRMMRNGLPSVIRALRAGKAWSYLVCAAAVAVVFTKSIDGLGRKLLPFGIEISAGLDTAASTIEEVGEAFIPVFIILAILARWRGRNA